MGRGGPASYELRRLKNELENSDLGWQFGVVMAKERDPRGGDSHRKGALQEAATLFGPETAGHLAAAVQLAKQDNDTT